MPSPQGLITTVKKEVPDTLTILHATVDANSKATTPAIRACYRLTAPIGAGCDETTVITDVIEEGATMPAFFKRTGDVISVESTDNVNDIKVYTLQVTHNTAFELANIVFNTVTIDLRVCVITDLDPPTAPVSPEYLIFATSPLALDLSSPGFV